MNYYFSYKAEHQLGEFSLNLQKRIQKKLRLYASQTNPFSFAEKLTDREGYRFRVGNHRVLFIIDNNSIKIIKIEPRDKAYD